MYIKRIESSTLFALCSLGGEVEGKEKEDESYYRYKELIKNLIRLTLLLR